MSLSIDPFPSEKKDQVELIYQWLVNYPDLFTGIALKRVKKYLNQRSNHYLCKLHTTMCEIVSEFNTNYNNITQGTESNNEKSPGSE